MQQRCLSHQVPRLPRETKVDVSKCHACHANSRGVPALHANPSATGASPLPYVPRLPRKTVSRCHQVPRLPSETKVDISKCHACHANCHTCHSCHAKVEVARLPRETKMDVSKCHACHANSRGVPAPHLKPSAPPEPAQCHKCHACHARVEVDVTKYHACHVKRKWMSPSATPATPTDAASRRHTLRVSKLCDDKLRVSTTPAT